MTLSRKRRVGPMEGSGRTSLLEDLFPSLLGPPCCPLSSPVLPSSRPPAPAELLFRAGGGLVGVAAGPGGGSELGQVSLCTQPQPSLASLSCQRVGAVGGVLPPLSSEGEAPSVSGGRADRGHPAPPHGPGALSFPSLSGSLAVRLGLLRQNRGWAAPANLRWVGEVACATGACPAAPTCWRANRALLRGSSLLGLGAQKLNQAMSVRLSPGVMRG